jgi:hypothetical protein
MISERCSLKWRLTNFLAAACIILMASSCGLTLNAQTIRIKLLDGKNGRPLAGKCVNVWVGNGRKDAMALPTNQDGVASLTLTQNDAQIDTQHVWKGCGLLGVINPIVKYSDQIKINASYVSCQPHTADFSWLAIKAFPVKEIVQSGIATANTCGKAKASPEPGEIILFVRPLSFWEKMKE